MARIDIRSGGIYPVSKIGIKEEYRTWGIVEIQHGFLSPTNRSDLQ